MLALRRRQVKTRSQLLREELNETVDHAMRAAGHAAGGVGAAVGPKVVAARETVVPRVRGAASRGWDGTVAVLTPLTEAAQAKVGRRPSRRRRAARMARRRWPVLAGLLATGAVVGVVAAAVVRRQRYEPDPLAARPHERAGLAEAEGGPEGMPAPIPEPVSVQDNRHPTV